MHIESAPPETSASTGSAGSNTRCCSMKAPTRSLRGAGGGLIGPDEAADVGGAKLDVAGVRGLGRVIVSGGGGSLDLGLEGGELVLEPQPQNVLLLELGVPADERQRTGAPH